MIRMTRWSVSIQSSLTPPYGTLLGYVEEVEEHYVVVTPTQERFPIKSLYCYYADTGTALHLTKGQPVSVTGRVKGEDGYTSRCTMFACDLRE